MWPWAPSAPSPPAEAPRISRERPVLRAPATATAIDETSNNSTNDSTTATANAGTKGSGSTPPPSLPWTGYPNERLSMPLEVRGPLLVIAAFIAGMGLGGTRGGQLSADRYRAENSHRYPNTEAGWYLYQRSKNYHLLVGACNAGVRTGAVLSLWAAGFMATEEGIDQLRARLLHRPDGQRDFLSTVVAALAVAGVHSRVHGMNTFTAVKTSKMALKAGFALGLAQDAVACLRGGADVPAYLRWLRPAASAGTSTTTSTTLDGDEIRL